jgi:flagellar biosynthesis protein FliR
MTALETLFFWATTEVAVLAQTYFLVFVRLGAAIAAIPVFGEVGLSVRLRLGAALAFSALVAPMVPAGPDLTFAAMGAEAVVGLMIGLAFRLLVIALQIAGAIAAQSTSLALIMGNSGADPGAAMAHFLRVSGLALLVTLGLHVQVVALFVLSYEMMPMARFPLAEDALRWGLPQVARAFELGFILSMPFVLASLLYYVALGAINRAMPTLMVAFIGAPALTALGLVLLLLAAPAMLAVWLDGVQGWLLRPFG